MSAAISSSMLQFLEWIHQRPRTYHEAMDAWRTSCPRLSLWDDAVMNGLITIENHESGHMGAARVKLTPRGRAVLTDGMLR